jgi:hypothetical protein
MNVRGGVAFKLMLAQTRNKKAAPKSSEFWAPLVAQVWSFQL